MVDRPMLFSAPMIRALAREADAPGTGKRQTRRILNRFRVFATEESPAYTLAGDDAARALLDASDFRHLDGNAWTWTARAFDYQAPADRTRWYARLPCAVGDRIWVRESWRTEARNDDIKPSRLRVGLPVYYEAGDFEATPECAGRLRSSIFMPRWASRLVLTVTDVRVERLNDISDADAVAEGARHFPDLPLHSSHRQFPQNADRWSMEEPLTTGDCLWSAKLAFANYWLKIHGPTSWRDNPFVVIPTFAVARANIDTMPKSEAA